MKFAATSLLVAGASASVIGGYGAPAPAPKNATVSAVPAYVTTQVYPAVITYCPVATEITWADKTYTVSKPTTLSLPKWTYTHAYASSYPVVPVAPTTPVAPVVPTTPVAPYVYYNATTPVVVKPSASYTTSSGPIQATANAASNAFAASGAALAGVFGAVAYLL
jgi:hypothetical protein